MTFSVVQRDTDAKHVIGTLWADDEPRAHALAAMFFPKSGDSLLIQRTEGCEIPMRLNVSPPEIH
jgi:hypothetical protein